MIFKSAPAPAPRSVRRPRGVSSRRVGTQSTPHRLPVGSPSTEAHQVALVGRWYGGAASGLPIMRRPSKGGKTALFHQVRP